MLITARDIVRRLPNADDDRIRLELAGNLCRCTGYNGIVRAIRQVLDARLNVPTIAPTPLPAFAFGALSPIGAPSAAPAMRPERPSVVRIAAQDAPGLNLVLPLTLPSAEVWRALRDPALVAAFIPGATLTAVEGEHISGEMTAALGPIRARFIGTAQITYDDDTRSGRLSGSGQDRSSVTRLSGDARFAVTDVLTGPGCELHLAIDYTLQGPLAQLGRPAIVSAVAAELASQVARNLQARLRGEATPAAHAAGIGFVLRLLWRHVLTRFRPNRD
jgi:carbon-monoxide dehydrogenase small subunit